MRPEQRRYLRYLETLTPGTLERLPELVDPAVRFRDPFNRTVGAAAMVEVFRYMFRAVSDISFTVLRAAAEGPTCFAEWRLEGRIRRRPWVVEGVSVIDFGADGRVVAHLDYWDAAGGLYEGFPLIGPLLGMLRRRLRAGPAPLPTPGLPRAGTPGSPRRSSRPIC